jgi:hypothetical protein
MHSLASSDVRLSVEESRQDRNKRYSAKHDRCQSELPSQSSDEPWVSFLLALVAFHVILPWVRLIDGAGAHGRDAGTNA